MDKLLNQHYENERRAYREWKRMMQHCKVSVPVGRNPIYPGHKPPGLHVCKQWYKFRNFCRDVGAPPPACRIDVIDIDKGYEPGNTRWVRSFRE